MNKQLTASLILALVSVTSVASAAETGVAGTGQVRARSMVNGISSVRVAMAETRLQKSEASTESSLQTVAAPVELPSRIEVSAGTDLLFSQNEVAKQASLFTEGRYRINEWLQVGGSVALRWQGNGRAREIALQPLFGPTFNFGTSDGISGAFFVSPRAGITTERTTLDGEFVNSWTKFTLFLSMGKRFELAQNVSFVPSVGILKQNASNLSYSFVPVAISIFL